MNPKLKLNEHSIKTLKQIRAAWAKDAPMDGFFHPEAIANMEPIMIIGTLIEQERHRLFGKRQGPTSEKPA